jgi:alpha-ribazole phosphatase
MSIWCPQPSIDALKRQQPASLEVYLSRLLLVRHGETERNSAQRYWGRTDVRLSPAGIRQAERLRDRLAGEPLSAVYASDLRRASATAEIIASRHDLAVTTCPELREIDFGEIEGLTFDEARRLYPEVVRLWIEQSSELKYPAGDSITEFSNRVIGFVPRLAKHAKQETVLIVAHSGVLRTLLCQLLGMETRHRWQMRLDLASLSVAETYSRSAVLCSLNDVCHLR